MTVESVGEVTEMPEKGFVAKLACKYVSGSRAHEMDGKKFKGIPLQVAVAVEALLHVAQHCAALRPRCASLPAAAPTSATILGDDVGKTSVVKSYLQDLQTLAKDIEGAAGTFKRAVAISRAAVDRLPSSYAKKDKLNKGELLVAAAFKTFLMECATLLGQFMFACFVLFNAS
jgi:hypothetical protein